MKKKILIFAINFIKNNSKIKRFRGLEFILEDPDWNIAYGCESPLIGKELNFAIKNRIQQKTKLEKEFIIKLYQKLIKASVFLI